MLEPIENRLPVDLLEKSIKSGSEYGWRKDDFLDVVEAARKLQIAIEGGLVQYVFEEGTCELHWLHYYTDEFKKGENWAGYCNRTAKECTERFKKVLNADIKKQATDNFQLVKEKLNEGIDIENHLLFILSFESEEQMPLPTPKEKEKDREREPFKKKRR